MTTSFSFTPSQSIDLHGCSFFNMCDLSLARKLFLLTLHFQEPNLAIFASVCSEFMIDDLYPLNVISHSVDVIMYLIMHNFNKKHKPKHISCMNVLL